MQKITFLNYIIGPYRQEEKGQEAQERRKRGRRRGEGWRQAEPSGDSFETTSPRRTEPICRQRTGDCATLQG